MIYPEPNRRLVAPMPAPGARLAVNQAKRRSRLYRWLVLGMVFYSIFAFGRIQWQIRENNYRLQVLTQRQAQLQLENQQLQQQKKELESLGYVESAAREKLGMIRPGEVLLLPGQPGKVMPLEVTDAEVRD